MGSIVTTIAPLAGGVAAVTGAAMKYRLELTGTWALDDQLTALLTARLTATSESIGYGPVTGAAPVYLKTYQRKLYEVAGTSLFFTALDAPTVFNKLNQPGNSFIEMANEYGFADDLLAVAIFRRKRLAIFGRRHIQIWNIDPDPAQNDSDDTLENEGTVNGASVRGIGKGDVMFCADSGPRSLAQRAAAEDAEVSDKGTPVDSLVQASMDAYGISGMCSIVEPRTNRYWLAIGPTIFVMSDFPSSGILAWSTYQASALSNVLSGNYVNPGDGTSRYYKNLTLTAGQQYTFTLGNGTNLTNGPESYAASTTFTPTSGASWVLYGPTASNPLAPLAITASLEEQSNFTPEKFVSFNGQIYVRDTAGKLYRYGGTDNATYDNSVCAWETPWLDGRTPGTEKPVRGMDAGMEGDWLVKLGSDPSSANPLKQVLRHTDSTFKLGSITSDRSGTHFKVRGETRGATYAKFGMFVYSFANGNQR